MSVLPRSMALIACLLASPALPAGEIDTLTSTLWNALSSGPGKGADAETLSRLFHAEARVYGAIYADGRPVLKVSPAAEFIRRQAEPGEQGFYECEIERRVAEHDRFATVYSVVESRTERTSAAPEFTGVNSVQWYRGAEGGWKILTLHYHVGRTDLPVPAGAGRSGLCLNAE